MATDVVKLPEHPRLGRTIVNLDARSKQFAARGALFSAGTSLLKSKTWRRPKAWDQGQTSQCVIYSSRGLAYSQPLTSKVPLSIRRKLDVNAGYAWCQENDDWPGGEPSYSGTSCLAGAKWLHQMGVIKAYRWGLGTDDALQILSNHGPCVIGVNWYDSMFSTDLDGFIEPSGSVAGGHAIELHGINTTDEYVVGTNSWGTTWGVGGRFRIRFETLRRLLKEDGECVTFDVQSALPTKEVS